MDQTSTSEPEGYDLFPVGAKGKLRIVPPPAGAETLHLKYYRRITMPSNTGASGLDIPEDYEDVFIAAAKAHFLADKGQPFREQWAYWNTYANDGIREIRRDERLVEDEDLILLPPMPRRVVSVNNPLYFGDY